MTKVRNKYRGAPPPIVKADDNWFQTAIENAGKPDKLFVYGIFLGEDMRDMYKMTNPQYATVKDFLTVGGHIVTAEFVPGYGLALTGLLVTPHKEKWDALDALEGGYERIKVRTSDGILAWMYAKRGTGDKHDTRR